MAKKPPKPPPPSGGGTGPRVKKAGTAKPSFRPPPTIPIDITRLSHGLPDWVKIMVADAILSFAEMEMALEEIIWDLLGLNYQDGKLVTVLDSSAKIELAKTLCKRYGVAAPAVPEGAPTMWRAMEVLGEARNKVAHGVWRMLDLRIPFAVSYRAKGNFGEVIGEPFDDKRLDAMTDQAIRIKLHLDRMGARAREQRAVLFGQSPQN